MTVVAWVRRNGAPSAVKGIVSQGSAGSCSYSSYALYTGGSTNPNLKTRFYIWNGTTTASSPPVPDSMWNGAWHMLAGTYDGTAVRIYLDGAEVGSGTPVTGSIGYGLARHNNLLIGGADGVPKLYQMFRTKPRMIGDDFNFIRKYPALEGRIFTVRFNKEGTRFVAGSSSDGKGEALVAQTDDAKLVSKLEGQRGPVYAAAYHPNGSLVATAGFDGMVRLNDPNNGKLIREFVPVPVRTKTAAK